MRPVKIPSVGAVLAITSIALTVCAEDQAFLTKRMADGKLWTTHNLDAAIGSSYCYEGLQVNCVRYGRLYTWDAARQACQSLGERWRLPTDDEWRRLAKGYGGVPDDSKDAGRAAYKALVSRGGSGFSALLGGSRSGEGQYAR